MKRRNRTREDEYYYDAKIKERIKEALSEQDQEDVLTVETLERWVEEDSKKRRTKRVVRWHTVFACALIVCVAAAITVPIFTAHRNALIAGKGDEQSTDANGDMIVKSNINEAEENSGKRIKTYIGHDGVEAAGERYEELMIPAYVPEGYILDKLEVTVTDELTEYKYSYYKDSQLLRIVEVTGITSTVIYDNDRELQCRYGDIYVYETEAEKNGTCKLDGQMLNVIGTCSDEEYIEIFNNWE